MISTFSQTNLRRIPIGRAYASTQVNATVFRVSGLISAGPFQYVTYYDPDGAIIVGQRRLPSETWDLTTLPITGNVRDAHNGVVLGVSSDGILHLSYDHHGHPLRYRRSERPHDIRSFGEAIPMTSTTEGHVTYPQFVPNPDGSLTFFYRDGGSGNGSLCLNRYEPGKGWRPLFHPLVDGENQCNPYWWRPAVGPDGALHLAWCWRDSGDARTNHDIGYIRSPDGGQRIFERPDGQPQPLPITRGNAYVADPIPTGANLINQCSATVDAEGRPHLAHYQSDANGIPQYVHLFWDGTCWVRQFVSRRKMAFTLGGGGTLAIPISRPEIAIGPSGAIYIITRDAEFGSSVRLYRSPDGDGHDEAPWEPIDLTPLSESLGEWEPIYDTERLRQTGILSLFVLPVRQGNYETVTTNAPQEAYLLEVPLT